jgi:putative ABC transport system ATP-binding protein
MSSAILESTEMKVAQPKGLRPAVVVRDLTKAFGDGDNRLLALKKINVEIRAGELTLLVGPSGCGKTTLISIVAGLLEPTEGHVEVLGNDLAEMSGTQLVNFRGEKIGFVFQQYNLLPALTAAENAAVPLIIARRSRQEAVAEARKVLESVGLGNRANAYPNTLSGGQQQRVAIARALVHNPHLLVCDEPTAALDAHSGRTVMELLKKVALQSDRAVIVVTHDSRVFDFGDRIIYMSDGEIERIETREEYLAHASENSSAAH